MNKKTTLPNLRKGFTLIELLVVITVIAILAAIAVPATTAVIRNARTAETTSNMKNIITALISYKTDEGGYPPAVGTSANDTFAQLFEKGHLDGGGESLFFVNGAEKCDVKPDDVVTSAGVYDESVTLIDGNNGLDYVSGLKSSAPSGAPIILDGTNGSGEYDPDLRGGKVLVATIAGGVVKGELQVDKKTVNNAAGINVVDTTTEIYGTHSTPPAILAAD